MRSKWFWMARMRGKLSIAMSALFTVDNKSPIFARINELDEHIFEMRCRPEFIEFIDEYGRTHLM